LRLEKGKYETGFSESDEEGIRERRRPPTFWKLRHLLRLRCRPGRSSVGTNGGRRHHAEEKNAAYADFATGQVCATSQSRDRVYGRRQARSRSRLCEKPEAQNHGRARRHEHLRPHTRRRVLRPMVTGRSARRPGPWVTRKGFETSTEFRRGVHRTSSRGSRSPALVCWERDLRLRVAGQLGIRTNFVRFAQIIRSLIREVQVPYPSRTRPQTGRLLATAARRGRRRRVLSWLIQTRRRAELSPFRFSRSGTGIAAPSIPRSGQLILIASHRPQHASHRCHQAEVVDGRPPHARRCSVLHTTRGRTCSSTTTTKTATRGVDLQVLVSMNILPSDRCGAAPSDTV
jgi:hypothetical protein